MMDTTVTRVLLYIYLLKYCMQYSISWNLAIAFALLIVGLSTLSLVPQRALAGTLVDNATTTSNNASTTLAKVSDVISFQFNLNAFGTSPTSTPEISVLNMGTTTMSATATTSAWVYSTTTTSAGSSSKRMTLSRQASVSGRLLKLRTTMARRSRDGVIESS